MASSKPATVLTWYNYKEWVIEIKWILESEGLDVFISKHALKIESQSELEKFKLIQIQTKTAVLIKSYCNPDIELEIRSLTDPKEIWTKLQTDYDKPCQSYMLHCLSEFNNICILPDEELPQFIIRFDSSIIEFKIQAHQLMKNIVVLNLTKV